jgi:hypothetical protein
MPAGHVVQGLNSQVRDPPAKKPKNIEIPGIGGPGAVVLYEFCFSRALSPF